jgi:hypothetical protein
MTTTAAPQTTPPRGPFVCPKPLMENCLTLDVKRYILLTLGYPNVEVELCDEQLEMAIRDTVDDFVRSNVFNLLRFWRLTMQAADSEYDLPADLRVVRDVTIMKLTEFDSLFGTDVLVNPLYLRNAKEAYQDVLTFWLSEAAFNTWRTVYGLNPTWDVIEGGKRIRIYPVPAGDYVCIIKGTFQPELGSIDAQTLGTKSELFRRMALARSMLILGRIRGKRVSGWRSSEGNVILDGAELRQEGQAMLDAAREELKGAGRPLGFYRG